MVSSEAAHIKTRVQSYVATLEEVLADVNKVDDYLAFFSDSASLEYTDYGIMHTMTNKPQLTNFIQGMAEHCTDWILTTRAVEAHEGFSVWEWAFECKMVKASPLMPDIEAKGQTLKMIGASLTWWGEGGRIVKNHDYGKWLD